MTIRWQSVLPGAAGLICMIESLRKVGNFELATKLETLADRQANVLHKEVTEEKFVNVQDDDNDEYSWEWESDCEEEDELSDIDSIIDDGKKNAIDCHKQILIFFCRRTDNSHSSAFSTKRCFSHFRSSVGNFQNEQI